MQAGVVKTTADRIWISLVDDDILVRRSLQLLLRSAGYEVRAYAKAEALLADVKLRMSACLITDRQMPGMDGFLLLRHLRERGWDKPAILITSSKESDLALRAARAGFHAVLVKPLLDQSIVQAVGRAVDDSFHLRTETLE